MTGAREIGAVIGTAVFGPGGTPTGGVTGAIVDPTAPRLEELGMGILSNLAADNLDGTILHPGLGQENHDMQRAFREATLEPVRDIGRGVLRQSPQGDFASVAATSVARPPTPSPPH